MDSSGNSNILLRTVKFTLLALIACCFVYCNTSNNKIASSFLKRKYTKGHFLDRPSKVSTDYLMYGNNTPISDAKPVTGNNDVTLINSNQPINNPLPPTVLFPKLLNYAGTIARNNSKVSYNSSPEGPAYLSGHPDIKRSDHGFAKAQPYLIGLIVCVALILLLLALASNATGISGNAFGGCFFILIVLLIAIVGIVFLILFLCALAPPAT